MKLITIGIDASNLSPSGLNPGTRTHLVECLAAASPEKQRVHSVIVWGSSGLLNALPDRTWLTKSITTELDSALPRRALWQATKLSEVARQAGCNVLFVPGGYYIGNFKPFIAMSQNMFPFEKREFMRYGVSAWLLKTLALRSLQSATFRRADGMIFLTEYARRTVKNVAGQLRGQIAMIPHGVNERFAKPPKNQRAVECFDDSRPVRILYVSTIDHHKHQWHVMKALSILRSKTSWPISIQFVGPAYPHAFPRFLEALKAEDPLGKWSSYCGAVPYTELHRIYAEADLGIFGSSCENMPNILLEKMVAGLPLACSSRGPMREVLKDGGEYFDPEKPNDIARAVEALVLSAEHREALAWKAYKYALRYSWSDCADKTFALFRAVHEKHCAKAIAMS